MFYSRYCELCKENGKSPSAAAIEIGISKSSVSTWKNMNRIPKMEQLQKIADYFGVTVDYLIGNVNEPFFYLDNARILAEINDDGTKKPTDQKVDGLKEVDELFSSLSPEQQAAAKDYLRFLAGKGHEDTK